MIRFDRARALAAASLALLAAPPAHAQFGGVVFDPSVYGQAVLQVSQSLTQIQRLEQQITQAQQMLAALPGDVTAPFLAIQQQAQDVLRRASGIGFSTATLTSAFDSAYPTSLAGQSPAQIAAALTDWQAKTRQALQDAMAMQNQVVATQAGTASAVTQAVGLSQAASGQTAAAQATNQLLATASLQLTQLQNLLMTTQRAAQTAQAEQAAITAAAQAESARAEAYAPPTSRITNGSHL